MNSTIKYRLAFLLIIAFVCQHCANIIPPSGGARDPKPPVLIKSTPTIESTNFTANKITLEFDEFFNLDNPVQNIIISPPMLKNPEYMIVGKKLIIKLKQTLLANVTYNINFGDAIKDYNEGNILKNFSYVFSTGSVLDTMQVSGTVAYAENNATAEGVIVGLYTSLDDSAVYKLKPYYFSKTDKDGSYRIKNIHAGSYKIVALKDENLDYVYDNLEYVGFAKNIIVSDSNTSASSDLKIFKEQTKEVKLIDIINPEVGVIKFIYNNPIANFKFDAAIYSTNDFAIINPTKDTVSYYYAAYTAPSTSFYVTTNNTILDTVRKELFFLKESEVEKNKIRFANPVIKRDANSTAVTSKHDLYKNFIVSFNRPFQLVNPNLIDVYEDSVLLSKDKYQLAPDAKDKTKLILNYAFHSNAQYKIQIKAAAIKDIFGFSNGELSRSFSTYSIDDYGSIIINNKIVSDKNYFLQIYDAAKNVVYSRSISKLDLPKKIILSNYVAGAYSISLIEDTNNNKRWDTGNYLLRKEAEKIFSINNNLVLKPGWEVEVDVQF